jgi:hypothetical protein
MSRNIDSLCTQVGIAGKVKPLHLLAEGQQYGTQNAAILRGVHEEFTRNRFY